MQYYSSETKQANPHGNADLNVVCIQRVKDLNAFSGLDGFGNTRF